MSSKILYLSRIYPNNIIAVNGLWVEGMVTAMSRLNEVRVIAPVPYCPPMPDSIGYAKNRKIFYYDDVNGINVYHPRFLSPPGYFLHSYTGDLLYLSIVKNVDRYREEFPFELIHAHFAYPDGYVAARLASRYNIPLVITEHAAWKPWMDNYPRVRRQAVWATEQSAGVIAGSRYLGETISSFTKNPDNIHYIPIGVNTDLFKLAGNNIANKNRRQLLYVGRIHSTKGVDVLFKAMSLIVKKYKDVQLVIIGGNLGFRNYQVQENKMRNLATELGINPYLKFVGMQTPENVARYMQESALLVLPSRRESFGTVLIEAMACGTPVVATRCGGPEDFVDESVGVLVDKDNPEALASGLERVLELQDKFMPADLNQYARNKFSWDSVAERTNQVYRMALS